MTPRAAPPVLPPPETKRAVVTEMFDRVAPRYERLNRFISLGQDRRWRRVALDQMDPRPGTTVLDLACGTGDLARDLAERGVTPIGIDLSVGMLTHAHGAVPFVLGDALDLPVATASVDGVVCGFALRNFVELPGFFAECARVTRPGGRVMFLDAAEPTNRIVRVGHGIWFRGIVPRIGALLSDADAYRYLPASTAYLPPGPELITMLGAAGFVDASRRTLMTGAVQILDATRARP